MLSFMKHGYSKRDIFVLRNVMEDAKYQIETSWVECDSEYAEKCCSVCSLRTVCKDIENLVNYLKDVENSVENVENPNP